MSLFPKETENKSTPTIRKRGGKYYLKIEYKNNLATKVETTIWGETKEEVKAAAQEYMSKLNK